MNNMIYTKPYIIEKWSGFDDCIFEALNDFYFTYHLMPKMLLANKHTFSQIDFMANIIPELRKTSGDFDEVTNEFIPVKEGEDFKLYQYATLNCTVEFNIENNIEDKAFVLKYDSESKSNDDELNILPIQEIKYELAII